MSTVDPIRTQTVTYVLRPGDPAPSRLVTLPLSQSLRIDAGQLTVVGGSPTVDANTAVLATADTLQSEDFSDSFWSERGSHIASDATAGPAGAVTADKLVEDTVAARHSIEHFWTDLPDDALSNHSIFQFWAGFPRDRGPNGKPSTTRVAIVGLLACTIALVALICWYVVTSPTPDPLVIGAIVGGVTALVANGIVALRNRNLTGETPKP